MARREEPSRPRPTPAGLGLLGVAAISLALAHGLAFWDPLDLAGMILGAALLAASLLLPRAGDGAARRGYPLVLLALLLLQLPVALGGSWGPPAALGALAALAALALAGHLAAEALGGHRRWLTWSRRLWFPAALVALLGMGTVQILSNPDRGADIVIYLSTAADRLLRLQAPYAAIPSPGNSFVRVTYLPGSILLVLPFRVLLGDVRWAYVAAEGLGALAVRAVVRRRGGGLETWREALVLLPLAIPQVAQDFYVSANNEWLLLGALGLSLWLLERGRHTAAGGALGLGLAAKQYFWVYPTLFLATAIGRRALLVAVALATLLILPFLLADPGNAILGMVGTVGKLAPAPDASRLTLWAALHHAGADLGHPGELALLLAGLLATAGLAARFRDDAAAGLAASGAAVVVAFLCAPFAAFNYYAYGLALFCWGTALRRRSGDRGEDQPAPA